MMMKSKVSMGMSGLYSTAPGLWSNLGEVETGEFILIRVEIFTPQHGIHPLDGGDAHPTHRIDMAGLQQLDVVQFGELPVFLRSREPLELSQGLASQVVAVHQEQYPLRSRMLDEAVHQVAGGEGLTAAGGHLDQRPRFRQRQRFLQVADGPGLHGPEAPGIQRRHFGEALAQVLRDRVCGNWLRHSGSAR